MIKKLRAILSRDLISTSRDVAMVYITIAPILISLIARLVLPTIGQSSTQVVMTQETARTAQSKLEPYLDIEVVVSDSALERRVMANDDTIGIRPGELGENYAMVLQGNENHDAREMTAAVLNKLENGGSITTNIISVNDETIPYRAWIGAFVGLTALFVGGLVMGLNIIEDKESAMVQAMAVSPLSRRHYVLARGLWVLVLGITTAWGSVWALGLSGYGAGIMLITCLCSWASAMAFGLAIGAISDNQLAGLASVKVGFLVVMLPAGLSLLIPQSLQWLLYWLPPYWVFACFRTLLVENGGWWQMSIPLVVNLLLGIGSLTSVYALLRSHLPFAQN